MQHTINKRQVVSDYYYYHHHHMTFDNINSIMNKEYKY